MLASAVHLTQVNFGQSVAVDLEYLPRFKHRGVDLPGVAHVEAELGLRQLLEQVGEFLGAPSDGLSLVHVLDAQGRTHCCPQWEIVNDVRVNDNVPLGCCDWQKVRNQLALGESPESAGRVQGDILVRTQVESADGAEQRFQLIFS